MKTWFRLLIFLFGIPLFSFREKPHVLWQICEADHKPSGMAMAPENFKDFLGHDFGWEDRFYLIGFSRPEKGWPYILPGSEDAWGGTGATSGIRSQVLNILFGITSLPPTGQFKLVVSLVDVNKEHPPLFKVTINGKSWEYQLPPGGGDSSLTGNYQNSREHIMEIPVDKGIIRLGGNEIQLTSLAGSWLIFDQVRLEMASAIRAGKTTQNFRPQCTSGKLRNCPGWKASPTFAGGRATSPRRPPPRSHPGREGYF